MERLQGTLNWKIKQWKAKTRSAKKFLRPTGSSQFSDLYNHQMAAILDISKAMMFLHSRDILFLDLKPENCGFDVNGKLKLFDFGLAASLDDKKKVGPDQYLLDLPALPKTNHHHEPLSTILVEFLFSERLFFRTLL